MADIPYVVPEFTFNNDIDILIEKIRKYRMAMYHSPSSMINHTQLPDAMRMQEFKDNFEKLLNKVTREEATRPQLLESHSIQIPIAKREPYAKVDNSVTNSCIRTCEKIEDELLLCQSGDMAYGLIPQDEARIRSLVLLWQEDIDYGASVQPEDLGSSHPLHPRVGPGATK